MWTATGKLVGALSMLRLPWWCQSMLPRPPGTRGFGSGLLRVLWRRASAAQTPVVAYSAAVSVCQHRSCRASHHPGSLSAFEKECVDKYDIRIDAQAAAASCKPTSRSIRHTADESLPTASGLVCVSDHMPPPPSPQIRPDAWAKIAKENLAHAEAAAAGQAATTYPTGEGRGAAVSDALLAGHSRFLAGTPANLQPSETVDATIVRHAATERPQRHACAAPAPRPRRARAAPVPRPRRAASGVCKQRPAESRE